MESLLESHITFDDIGLLKVSFNFILYPSCHYHLCIHSSIRGLFIFTIGFISQLSAAYYIGHVLLHQIRLNRSCMMDVLIITTSGGKKF